MQNRFAQKLSTFIALILLAVTPALVSAQSPSVEWNRWDANITVHNNSDQLQIAENQEVHVVNGTVHKGQRYWTSPVNVQSVYIIMGNGSPVELTQNNSGQANTYALSNSGGQTTLNYYLPQAANANDTFVVQINYTAASPTTGMVDWKIIPADHNFTVRSSTVRIQFPDGQAPSQNLIRSSSDANVQVNGNQVLIQSAGPIAASQAFSIQVPYGAGVGAPANPNSGSSNNANSGFPNNGNSGVASPSSPDAGASQIQLPGAGTILLIICVVGLLLMWGGGSLLRSILGGFLGGNRGIGGYPGSGQPGGGLFNPFGGGRSGGSSNPYSGSSEAPVERGFRSSSNQDREIGNIGNDKDSGGGASFG